MTNLTYKEQVHSVFTKQLMFNLESETAVGMKTRSFDEFQNDLGLILGVSSVIKIGDAELAHLVAHTLKIFVTIDHHIPLELPVYMTTNYNPYLLYKPLIVEKQQLLGINFEFTDESVVIRLNKFRGVRIIETSLHIINERIVRIMK